MIARRKPRKSPARKTRRNTASKSRYEVFVIGDGFRSAHTTKALAMAKARSIRGSAYVLDTKTGAEFNATKANSARRGVRKARRSPAQKAATRRMIAANKRRR